MKRLGLDGLDSTTGPSRHGKSLRAAASRRPRALVLAAVAAADVIRSAGFLGARARDFEDFVAGDRGWTASLLPLPDPSFRERLRRRLWRIQVLTRRDRGVARH